MTAESGSKETLLYLIANRDLGWRKIGVGFGYRLEKWRRDGWILEQQVLFESREDALLAEAMLKRHISSLALDHRERLDEGHSEMWPYEYGPIDLAQVKAAVDTFTRAMEGVWPMGFRLAHMGEVFRELARLVASGKVAQDHPDLIELAGEIAELNGTVASTAARKFIREREPSLSREDVEAYGLDWKDLVRSRQEYWAALMASEPAKDTADKDSWE